VTWRGGSPRQNVTSDVLARLLRPAPLRGRPEYRPPPASAARTLDNSLAAEFRHEYSRHPPRRHRQRVPTTPAPASRRRGSLRPCRLLGLYVTVTVTDPAQLPRAAADTEASAEASKIRLQRLYRSQAAGFTATLPCGICLPELAHRLRH
jgi:hypothetical protein